MDQHGHCTGDHHRHAPTRRTLLAALGTGGVVALAGCLGDDEEVPDPIGLDDDQACDQCEMVIDVHPGPVGLSYYLDDPPDVLPDDRENGAAYFCSSWCAYRFTLDWAERDFEPVGTYLTDYSAVDYSLSEDAGTLVISAHLEVDALALADDLTLVVDSDVEGAMGSSLIGFSDSDDAEAFAEEYGGDLLDHDDVTLEVISAMGM